MQYRTFGELDWKVSALGFGAMRLPVIDADPAQIYAPEATRMLRYAIDQGVNYVDTAYPYHRGTSESFLSQALQDGYRERIRLATKMPVYLVEKEKDFDRYLDEQLERLQADFVDFYLLHGLNKKWWGLLSELHVLAWAERALASGRFHYLGFSFHDSYQLFQQIVDATDLWSLCQIQYNYMDVDYQAGARGLQYAAHRGLPVVVMEPLRGGRLTKSIPPTVQAIWDSAPAGATPQGRPHTRTPAEWGLQWLWNQPKVSVVLSGMSTMEQVEENLASADRSGPGTLAEADLATVDRVRQEYERLCPIPCTDCKYCLPCPSGVNIPRILEIYNDLAIYGDQRRARLVYSWLSEGERANLCVECGECLEKCPQSIEIPDWLKKAHEALC